MRSRKGKEGSKKPNRNRNSLGTPPYGKQEGLKKKPVWRKGCFIELSFRAVYRLGSSTKLRVDLCIY